MLLKKYLSGLLAGASVATLAVASIGRATAGVTVTTTGHVPYALGTSTDWVDVNGADLSSFTNGVTVSPGTGSPPNPDAGPTQAIAVDVDNGSTISTFNNLAAGRITAQYFNEDGLATATALLIHGGGAGVGVPVILNSGTIKALATSIDTSEGRNATATAHAAGINWASNGKASESA